MIFQKGINQNDYDNGIKRRRKKKKNTYTINNSIITKWEVTETPFTFNHKHFEQWL